MSIISGWLSFTCAGSDYYNKEPHGHISDLTVAAGAERQGIARALMQKAEGWARQHGYRWLSLSVFAQITGQEKYMIKRDIRKIF